MDDKLKAIVEKEGLEYLLNSLYEFEKKRIVACYEYQSNKHSSQRGIARKYKIDRKTIGKYCNCVDD